MVLFNQGYKLFVPCQTKNYVVMSILVGKMVRFINIVIYVRTWGITKTNEIFYTLNLIYICKGIWSLK